MPLRSFGPYGSFPDDVSMTKLTSDSFLAVLRKSEVLDEDKLAAVLADLESSGIDVGSPRTLASGLVKRGALTVWQAENLLKGKHRGLVLGKYRLLSLLGKGGMSSVYLAEHTLMRRRCAVKVLPTKRVGESSYLGRFHREAQAVASLDHPNIVRAYDVDHAMDGEHEIHFLVMEYVEGRDLQVLVTEEGPLDFIRAAEYARQSAEGLAHAHDSGLVHRDVKPANLLVDKHGVVKILDMGLARFFDDQDEKSLTVANDERVLGTADYLAPEQAVDSHTSDHRADIYGLGCSLYFVLTGHPPFTEGTLTQRLLAHQTKEPPPIEQERPGTPPGLVAILRKAMAKKPDNRFQNAREMADELMHWLAEHGDSAWQTAHQHTPRPGDSSKILGRESTRSIEESRATSTRTGGETVAAGTAAAGTAGTGTPPPADDALSSFLTKLDSDVVRGPSASDAPPRPAPERPAAPPVSVPKVAKKPGSKVAARGDRVGTKQAEESRTARRVRPLAAPVVPAAESAPAAPVAVEPARVESNDPDEAIPVADAVSDDASEEVAEAIVEVAPGAVPEAEIGATSASGFPIVVESPPGAGTSAPSFAALPTSKPQAGTSRRRTATSNWWESRNVKLGAAGAGALLVLLAIVWFAGSGRKSDSGGGGGDGASAAAGIDPTERRLTVGPEGQFPTIGQAISYIGGRKGTTGWEVNVMGDATYAENVKFTASGTTKFPEGVRFVSRGNTPAILSPAKGADRETPVVLVEGVEGLILEGFRIDAEDHATAIELTGACGGLQLTGLELLHYSAVGISCRGAYSVDDRPISIMNSRFEGGETAIRVDVSLFSQPSSDVLIVGNRLVRNQQGLLVNGATDHLEVRGNLFLEQPTGIAFAGGPAELKRVFVGNNTFHRVRIGLQFATVPEESSTDVVLARNLFAGQTGHEAVLANGRNVARWRSFDTSDNWTSRPRPAKPEAGGPTVIDLVGKDGKYGSKFEFVNESEGTAGFLKPKTGAAHANVPGATPPLRPYIGAIEP